MTAVTPEFLKVSPDDIARVGPMGACILALVRYATALPGESNGRRIVDGAMWWRATHPDIGQSLGGVPHDTVRRTLVKLQRSGDLLSIPSKDWLGDHSQAYRVPDQPLRKSASSTDQPLRENASSITRKCVTRSRESASPDHAKVRDLPITGELEEVREKNPLPPELEPEPEPRPATRNGAELARQKFSTVAKTGRSPMAEEIARVFSRSLPVQLEHGLRAGVAAAIDKCLQSGIQPAAIAEGLKAWNASDSWSPTQIPNFVNKAANQAHAAARTNNGAGKPTQKAQGWEDAANELLNDPDITFMEPK